MTYTTHGHHILGTVMSERPDGMLVARCGGPNICSQCGREAAMARHPASGNTPISEVFSSDAVIGVNDVPVTYDGEVVGQVTKATVDSGALLIEATLNPTEKLEHLFEHQLRGVSLISGPEPIEDDIPMYSARVDPERAKDLRTQ